MTNNFPNAWVEVVLEQLWIVRQTTSVVAKCIDTELLCDPQALTDYCLNPSEERLNPLEFHGKRCAPAQPPRSGKAERDAASHGQPRRPGASYADLDHQGGSLS
jgi:hypothetical protein